MLGAVSDAGYFYRTLPRRIQGRVEDLVASLLDAAGEELVAIVVAGGVARGEFHEATSDVDLLVVLRSAGRELLTRVGRPIAIARAAARVDVKLLIEAEIPRSSDVFPLWFEDVRANRHVLHGKDPFTDLEVRREHQRLRVEQELREATIALRLAAAEAHGDGPMLAAAVEHITGQLRRPLRALLNLVGVPCETHALDLVLGKAGKRLVVPVSRLTRPSSQPEEAYDELEHLLAKAVAEADLHDAEAT
jgi:predicted nucleotidyltransferase